MNTLYFADYLDVLKDLCHHHPDLSYIDPPFNSKRDYNILFESIDIKVSTDILLSPNLTRKEGCHW